MPQPDSTALAGWDKKYVLHGLHSPADGEELVVFEGGEGVLVRDAQGREYIDGLSGLWNVNLGHGRRELVEAAAEQMGKLAFCSTYSGQSNIPTIRLAARLEGLAYPRLKATFFTTSGADANEAAFKTARYYWRRKGQPEKVKVISRFHGYHGVTLAAMSATGIETYWRMFEPRVPNFAHVPAPYAYRFEGVRPGETVGAAAARALEEEILRQGPETVAAFIAEPVQGAGGVIVPPEDYFPRIRAICDAHQVLLIADEVITGFGRTGRWFGLTHWDVEPDIMTFAKGVTSGYLPLGGVMISDAIWAEFSRAAAEERWMHASTYSGHPVCCAVALRTLDIIEQEGLVERAAKLGRYLLDGLATLMDLDAVGEVRGLGLMAAVELTADRDSRKPFPADQKVGERVRKEAERRGLIHRVRGDVINLAPPFVITEGQVERVVAILRDAIRAGTR
ncbi:MAG: aspartate aminotransferase family protein [candidate division NC10 bacterium]|nr:aspartate aminotransferase family protein [candidate division NC10 bacterium]